MKQLKLFKEKVNKEFGGALLKGRKSKRPLSTKCPIHLTLRSTEFNLRRNERKILNLWNKLSKKFHIKTYKLAIMSNHIHASIKIEHRDFYNKFIQALTGLLARRLNISFMQRPWTRILTWGREFHSVIKYIEQNILEVKGVIPYKPRTPTPS